ncbi:hypothetical protein C9975_06715 [Thalassospira xiamenensis]|nr:hypothetical protein C9975_06715 [Thalassospira xiamenensis]
MSRNLLIPSHSTDDLFDPDIDIARVEKTRLELRKTIQPGVTLSGYQRKSLNALMWFVQSYCFKYFDSIEKFHAALGDSPLRLSIPKSHFCTITDYGSRNAAFLKKALREVSQVQVVYDNGKTGDLEKYEFINMFKRVGVDGPRVEFEVHPETRRAIVSLDVEATIDLIKVNRRLNGKYAIGLYEVLHSAFERMRKDIETVEISDYDLRAGLNVPYKEKGSKRVFSYSKVGQFNAKVLKPSIDEINANDFEFKIEHSFRKKGCGDVIWFFTLTKTQYQNYTLIANENADEVTKILDRLGAYSVRNPQDWLKKCVNEKELLYMLFCVERVDAALRKRGTKINSPGGYFVRTYNQNREAFEEHYIQLLETRAKQAKLVKEETDLQIKEQKENAAKRYVKEMREAHWNDASEHEKETIELAFIETRVKPKHPEYQPLIEKNGLHETLEDIGVLRGFWTDFLNELFGITEEDEKRAANNATVIGHVK